MYQLAWMALICFGIGSGGLMAISLAVPRRWVMIAALGSSIAATGMVAAIGSVWSISHRFDTIIAAAFLGAGAAAGGYALYAAALPRILRPRRLQYHLDAAPAEAAPLMPAVILLSDAEPSDYDPRAVSGMLLRNESAGAPLPPGLATPLVYAAERSRYGRLGQSPARATVAAIAASVDRRLAEAGRECAVTVAYCENGPSLAGTLASLAARGHSPLVVLTLGVARTYQFADAFADLAELSNVRVEIADPLWTSPELVRMSVDRILASVEAKMAESGVCLALPGEPLELERANGASSEQQLYFAERVRAELVDAGIPTERVRRGWIQWEEPDVLEVARHLSAVGATNVVFVPLTAPAETCQTLLDLRYAAEHASADTGVSTVVLGAWGDDPVVADVLARQALELLERTHNDASDQPAGSR